MNIFISHSSEDASIATNLCNTIEKYGDRCFIAPRNIRTGYEYAAEIAEGIDHSDILILLLSKAANASPHVLREVKRAVTKSIPVLVYKLEDVELSKSMEYFLMTHQWLNAQKNDFSDIIQSISQFKKNKMDNEFVEVVGTPEQQSQIHFIAPIIIIVVALILCIVGIVAGISIAERNERNNPSVSDDQNDATTDNNAQDEKTSSDEDYEALDEMTWLEDSGIPYLAEPTPQAISDNETFWYRDYCTDYHYTATFWRLREPAPDSSSQCYLVDYGKYNGELIPWEVGVESFGIRPAITVDLTADCVVVE